jgi:hypothetical protein
LAAAGFSDTQLKRAGLPTGAALATLAKYPIVPDVVRAI